MLRFCSAELTGGGIKSEGNVSLSGHAIVSGCTAIVGGAVAISGAMVELREAAAIVSCAAMAGGKCHLLEISTCSHASHVGGVASLLEARTMMRDNARITACSAAQVGGGIYGESTITLAGAATISRCAVLLLNAGQGGCILGANGALVELRDHAKVVECQAQGTGGCIAANDIFIGDRAHVGNCIAHNSNGLGMGGCLAASSSIVMRDFASLTSCSADVSGAILVSNSGTLLLSGNAMVSDCTATLAGAVLIGLNNNTVILQDNATISRASTGFFGTFHVQGNSSFLMMGRASIRDCFAPLGSGLLAYQANVMISGHNSIVNCTGVAYSEPASSRVVQYRRNKSSSVGYFSITERRSRQTGC